MRDDFLKQMDSELAGWDDPVRRLRGAIENNEFTLYWQPILQFSGEPRYPMAEVLVRLREEEQALLPPGEFLPVFEHYRMMPQLDRWVVRHTVKRLVEGSRIPGFTVNLSGQTLEDEDFPRFVAAQLSTNKLAPERLLFEIDESDVLARLETAARFSTAITAYGGGVLLDGFCRRAVSFAPLKKVRVDFVKVDGCVTRKLLASEAADTKLKAVLSVAEMLGVDVVAECVEEQDVLARLRELKVGFAQGFEIAKPQPIAQIALKP